MEQAIRIIEAGGKLVRITAPGVKEARNLENIHAELRRRGYTTPLSADIHFNPEAAIEAAKHVEKVRINPGNFVDKRATFKTLTYTDEEYAAEIEKIRERARATGDTGEDVLELLDMIERGFDDIEHRISNMDKEHSKYVRATVTRLNYLLSGESDTKGLVIQLLNRMSEDDYEEVIQKTGEKMNLSLVEILSEKSLYKRRKNRKDFVSQMAQEEEVDDLDREDVLRLNRIKRRFSQKQIEEFIEEHIEKDVLDTEKLSLTSEEDFEKLILAYDLSTRKNSKYKTLEEDAETIEKNGYRYPALKFVRRHL